MLRKPFLLLAISALVVASLGCRITTNIPVQKISTGPVQTDIIKIKPIDAEIVEVNLEFGAGDLKLAPGNEPFLIDGKAEYNIEEFKPVTRVDGSRVYLETGNFEIGGWPDLSKVDNIKNKWDLALGAYPMNLTIQAGACTGNYELGGLPLNNLDISDGASEVVLSFSEPNPNAMQSLRYTTGASNVRLLGLGRANFSSFIFRSGAGNYTLDFSGGLLRDGVVTIESGVSQVTVIVPEGIQARVLFKGGLVTINASGEWTKAGDQYEITGSGPVLTINVDMGMGTLNLQTSEL
jgi:hypothetical protein